MEDFASEPVIPFPENVQALELFKYLETQWRMGPSGPTGFDYNAMHHKMDRMKLDPEQYEQLEDDVRVMERAALGCIHAKT